MRVSRNLTLTGWMICVSVTPVAGQTTPLSVPSDVAELSAGWAALARGDLAGAAASATVALGRDTRSVAAAALLVEANTRRLGASAGLDVYDQWLGTRRIESPYLLRTVALGVLRESRRPGLSDDTRREAYRGLVAALGADSLSSLSPQTSTDLLELQVMGEAGNDLAVRRLIARLRTSTTDRERLIGALRETHSPSVEGPLVSLLGDRDAAIRSAAADALGRLTIPLSDQPMDRLRALIKDADFNVRFSAARALYRLRDGAGFAVLRGVQLSGTSMQQVEVLEATAANVDAAWLSSARRLLSDADPNVRLAVADLLAPHDLNAAMLALQTLLSDDDPRVRIAAERTFVERIVADYPSLRRFLRSSDELARVRAATRILELTR